MNFDLESFIGNLVGFFACLLFGALIGAPIAILVYTLTK